MASQKVLDMIHDALIAHGMDAVRGEQDVTLQSSQLRFEAEVFEPDQQGPNRRQVLEIYIYSPLLDVQPVIESFAGFGDTREQELNQAFEKFLRGVFHVAIEGLADHVCDNMQAEVEVWQQRSPGWKVWQKNLRWKIYGGPVISQATTGAMFAEPGLSNILCQAGKAVHSLRFPRQSFRTYFFCSLKRRAYLCRGPSG